MEKIYFPQIQLFDEESENGTTATKSLPVDKEYKTFIEALCKQRATVTKDTIDDGDNHSTTTSEDE